MIFYKKNYLAIQISAMCLRSFVYDFSINKRFKCFEFFIFVSNQINGTVKSIHANRPGEGIINAAREANADVIITGSRGTGKLRRTFLGSVSDYVLHHSDVPVIVCRHKDHHHHHHHGDKHDQDVK